MSSVLIAACSSGSASPSSASRPSTTTRGSRRQAPRALPGPNLTVLGAASLKGVLDKAKAAYETANPGTTLTISTDSSAALETKDRAGRPGRRLPVRRHDEPEEARRRGFASGAAVTFAGNKLTVIVPTANPAGITTPADLAKTGVKVIAAGDAVPITKYATQLVANLAKETGYPADFAAAYTANIVSRKTT